MSVYPVFQEAIEKSAAAEKTRQEVSWTACGDAGYIGSRSYVAGPVKRYHATVDGLDRRIDSADTEYYFSRNVEGKTCPDENIAREMSGSLEVVGSCCGR